MKKQPLHYACDTIYACIANLEGINNNLNSMQLLSAHSQVEYIKKRLDETLSALRNKALRDEGEYKC